MSTHEPGIWNYRDKHFNTKTERDMYIQGFLDGLREGQKTHIRTDTSTSPL